MTHGDRLAFAKQSAVAVDEEYLGHVLIVDAYVLFLGFAHRYGEAVVIVGRKIVGYGRGGGFVVGMSRNAVVILDSAHVYFIIGTVLIGLVDLGIFGLGNGRFPLKIGEARRHIVGAVRGAFPVERKAGICPNGIVARIVAVVINGQGEKACSRNVGRNVLCGSFSVHNVAFVYLLPVGKEAENHSAGVCGVVKADFCRKGPYIYSADVKIKLGDIAGISVVLRINGKTLVKALGADFYVGICLDGIVGIVYDLLRGKGGHVHIARMGERESNRRVAENGKSVALGFKSDRLCSRGKCGLKLFKLIL